MTAPDEIDYDDDCMSCWKEHRDADRAGRPVWFVWMLGAAAIFGILVFWASGCSMLRGVTQLDTMDAAELDRFSARMSLQIELVARAALAEGDITAEALDRVASALEGLVAGSAAPLSVTLDLQGYSALALLLVLSELDAELDARGAYDGPGWVGAQRVLGDVAVALRRVAQP